MVEGSARTDLFLLKTRRFRRRIAVECWPLYVARSGPEARADHLVRVPFASDCVGSGPFRRPAPGEPGEGQIETPPEELQGAALADKSRPEFLEDNGARQQNPPEALGKLP